MDWFRWWHGTLTDPKFRWVARKSGCSFTSVIALWVALLERASAATNGDASVTRGDVTGFDCDAHDALLDVEDGTCAKILEAFVDKGLISEGRIAAWEKRQAKREDSSAERTRAYRERKAAQKNVTIGDASVTQCDAIERDVTPREDKSRGDKSKEGKTKTQRAPRFDAQAHLVSLGVDPQVSEDWLSLRKKKNLAATETAFKGVEAEAVKAGISMDEALRVCCTRGWGGFNSSWLDGNRSGAPRQASSYHDERAETIAALTGRNKSHELDDRTIDIPAFRLVAG